LAAISEASENLVSVASQDIHRHHIFQIMTKSHSHSGATFFWVWF